MERRTLLLIASLLVAALGTSLVWLYVQGADNRARSSQDLVDVYVATRTFPANATGDDVAASLARRQLPRDFVEALPGVVTDVVQLRGQRATTTITANVPLVASQFSAKGAAPTSGVDLDPGSLALALQLNDPNRVAGLLRPGSRVTIYATIQKRGSQPLRTIAFLTNIKVLAADGVTEDPPAGTTARSATASVSKALVYLQVTPRQSAKIVLTQSQGSDLNTLYLALQGERTTVTTGDRPGAAVSGTDILESEPRNGG